MTARAAAALCALLAAGPAWPQAGPDDGPDLVISGEGGPDWLAVCRGQTIFGDYLEGSAGGPRRAGGPDVTFLRVGHLECHIEAGAAPLTLRLEKYGGEAFCPLTGRRGPGPCETRFAPGQMADFTFDAVP